jgi:hypothetical protein
MLLIISKAVFTENVTNEIMAAGKIGERSKINKIFHAAYLYEDRFMFRTN